MYDAGAGAGPGAGPRVGKIGTFSGTLVVVATGPGCTGATTVVECSISSDDSASTTGS